MELHLPRFFQVMGKTHFHQLGWVADSWGRFNKQWYYLWTFRNRIFQLKAWFLPSWWWTSALVLYPRLTARPDIEWDYESHSINLWRHWITGRIRWYILHTLLWIRYLRKCYRAWPGLERKRKWPCKIQFVLYCPLYYLFAYCWPTPQGKSSACHILSFAIRQFAFNIYFWKVYIQIYTRIAVSIPGKWESCPWEEFFSYRTYSRVTYYCILATPLCLNVRSMIS